MSDAAAQLRRILHLIPELADDRDHPIAEVAERLGVDRRTLLRDLDSLVERYDDPGGFVEGLAVYVERETVSVQSSHFRRPMRLTRAELAALELGLAMLHGERPHEEHVAIAGARRRLRDVIARLPEDEHEDGLRWAAAGGDGDPALLARLRSALRERRKVRLAYHKAADAEAATRVICPYATAFASGQWYLVAHCERSDDIRVFRLDRIEGAEVLEQGYERPAGFEAELLLRDGRVFHGEPPRALRVRYSPRVARWIAEREGREPEADGSLTVEHPLADADWAVRHVLQYGPDAEVLGPPELRSAIRERLEAMLDD